MWFVTEIEIELGMILLIYWRLLCSFNRECAWAYQIRTMLGTDFMKAEKLCVERPLSDGKSLEICQRAQRVVPAYHRRQLQLVVAMAQINLLIWNSNNMTYWSKEVVV